ncbi:MAG: RelA/SpoT family protein [Bacilli bacterium]|jgi:guanosine-3',5'-bis(diphosphate) 3'-pyrophosphohydrolase
MTKEKQINFTDLLTKVKTYIHQEDELKIIKKAYDYAALKHYGKKRLDGNDFITHPLNVAYILTDLTADYMTIVTALLHEIIDEGQTSLEEVKKNFGEEIGNLIDSITKINRLSFSAENEWTIAYYSKILVGLCEDVRIIFIKLGDRLHNMRTLWAIPDNKQKEKAKETLEILAPIAHRLGIYNIKSELEDLSLKYYKPDIYLDILGNLNNTKAEREHAIKEMKFKIMEILNNNNIKHEIKGRSKSVYSIYQKMQTGRKFKEIYDILALRVYVETEQNCYLTLGLIHSKFKPVPKRFKDYVAMPKENMYQSLHTTVFGIDGHLFEIQIRTYEMDKIAEYGLASHWSYKESSPQLKNVMEKKLAMFRSLIDLNNEEHNPEEFIKNVESEILKDNIYVFTPKGDVIELPIGSTPIDFAYRVHSEIGEKMVGAIVNDNIVPLDYELQDGEIVKININKNSKGPSREWVYIAKTAQAKNKIKNYFRRIDKDDLIEKGEELLNKELRKRKLVFSELFTNENMDLIFKTLAVDNINDIYHNIGSSNFTPNHVLNIITKETKAKEKELLNKMLKTTEENITIKNDILVEGIDEIKITLANCCGPVKGDKILGYITKGQGITVHRIECHNITNKEERLIEVSWNQQATKKWLTNIVIETESRDNFLLDLFSKTSNHKINVKSVEVINSNGLVIYDLKIMVEDKDLLKRFLWDVLTIPNVHKAKRVIK